MSGQAAQERIAQLQARAQAQRLAAQLAMLEAHEQLAPLRNGYNMVRAAAGVLSPGRPAGNAIAALARFGSGHPWLASAVAAAAVRVARRRPLAIALAAGIVAVAWWLWRSPARAEQQGQGQ
jgi:hypothetical protein